MARTPGSIVKMPYLQSARAYAWARIRKVHQRGEDFSITELIEHLARRGKIVERSNLRIYVGALMKDGILEVVATAQNGKPSRYRLVRDLGTIPPVEREDGIGITDPNVLKKRPLRTKPRAGARRGMIWKAIRVFGQRRATFTVDDLAELVIDESSGKSPSGIQQYLAALVKSGHLSVVSKDPRHTYRVERDTGPKHPMMRRGGSVYDPNDQSESRQMVSA